MATNILVNNGRLIGSSGNPPDDPTPYKTYTRPSEWIDLPSVTSGEDIIHLLVAVFEDGDNYLGFRCAGDFEVDWGDGFSTGYTANHPTTGGDVTSYNIQYSGVSSVTTTSYGYRQAIVTITPQSGQTLTNFDIDEVPFAGTGGYGNTYNGVLEIRLSVPNLTSGDLGSSYSNMLEHIDWVGPHSITNATSMFSSCPMFKLSNFNMYTITDASNMFYSCGNLIELPDLDTSNVLQMDNMFYGCNKLERVPVFDCSSVTTLYRAFYACSSLREVELNNTNNCTTFRETFTSCSVLRKVRGISTSNSTTCQAMFQNCLELWSLPTIDLSNCTNASSMFQSTSFLTKNLSITNTGNVTNMTNMFSNSVLYNIPMMDTSSVTTMANMFYNTKNIKTIPLFNTSNVTNMVQMFYSSNIESLPSLDMSSVTDANNMFRQAAQLTEFPDVDTSNIQNFYRMFYAATRLRSVGENFSTSSGTNFREMFSSCYDLISLPTIDFGSSVSTPLYTFQNCRSLTSITCIGMSAVTSCINWFQNNFNLESVSLDDTSNVTTMQGMFQSCYKLQEGPNMDLSSCTNMQQMFYDCNSLRTIPQYNTSGVTTMSQTFYSCGDLIELPTLDISNVTNTYRCFYTGVSQLRKIGSWDLSSVTSSADMFNGSTNNLAVCDVYGVVQTIEFQNNNLNRDNIVNIFNNLGTVSGKIINVSNNPGTSSLSAADLLIATSKGWTVTT